MSGNSEIKAPPEADGFVLEPKVRPGVWVHRGQVIALLKAPPAADDAGISSAGNLIKVKAEEACKILKLVKCKGDVMSAG